MTKDGPGKVDRRVCREDPARAERCLSSPEHRRRGDGAAVLLPTILFADADEHYRAMARDALLEGRSPSDLRFVADGQEMLDYLDRRGRHQDPITSPRPALIVLDMRLPRLGGLDAVRTIKSSAELRRIPVVALTDDGDRDAVGAAYDAGINTYFAKPVTFLALVRLMKVFTAYWLDTAVLPPEREAA